MSIGSVQWFRIAPDDRGGFHFVPAFCSEVALPAQALAPEAGRSAAAAAQDLSQRPIRALPIDQPA